MIQVGPGIQVGPVALVVVVVQVVVGAPGRNMDRVASRVSICGEGS